MDQLLEHSFCCVATKSSSSVVYALLACSEQWRSCAPVGTQLSIARGLTAMPPSLKIENCNHLALLVDVLDAALPREISSLALWLPTFLALDLFFGGHRSRSTRIDKISATCGISRLLG